MVESNEPFQKENEQITESPGKEGQFLSLELIKESLPLEPRILVNKQHFVTCKNGFTNPLFSWKRLKGKNPEGKTFQRLLRRKQSSTKISKMSRNYLRSSQSDIFHLLRNLLEYLLQTFFLPRSFQMYLTFAFLAFGSFRFSLFVQSFLPRGRFW